MKRFARCILILILVTVLGAVGGYFYEDKTLLPVYTSTAQLYIVPGEENEATIRANNGGLKDDFVIIFKSGVVIQEAQREAGTSENIADYLTVSSPANSNIVVITCTNPDQNTAKKYVDAVAKTALKTTSIIPVKSIQILSEGTSSNEPVKPDLYRNTALIAAAIAGALAVLELIIVLLICAFKKPEDHSDDETEYERYYGKYAPVLHQQERMYLDDKETEEKNKNNETQKKASKNRKYVQEEEKDAHDILEDFDEDYSEKDRKSVDTEKEDFQTNETEDFDLSDDEIEESKKAEVVEPIKKEQKSSDEARKHVRTEQEDEAQEVLEKETKSLQQESKKVVSNEEINMATVEKRENAVTNAKSQVSTEDKTAVSEEKEEATLIFDFDKKAKKIPSKEASVQEEAKVTKEETQPEPMTPEMLAQTEVVAEIADEAAATEETGNSFDDRMFENSSDWAEEFDIQDLDEESAQSTSARKVQLHSSDQILGVINK